MVDPALYVDLTEEEPALVRAAAIAAAETLDSNRLEEDGEVRYRTDDDVQSIPSEDEMVLHKRPLPGHDLQRSPAQVQPKKARITWTGQRFHFTFKGHLDLKDLLDHFDTAGGGLKASSAVHENGHSKHDEEEEEITYSHTHVLIWWKKTVNWSAAGRWDYHGVHPNWKPVTTVVHFRRVLQYHKKEPVGGDLTNSDHYQCTLPADFKPTVESPTTYTSTELIEKLRTFPSWARVLADPELSLYIQKSSSKMNYVRQLYDALEELTDPLDPLADVSLYDWQKRLELFLTTPADSRSILWICDEKGGCGKSSFARYYECKNPSHSLFFTGKEPRDMATAISKSRARRVFFYDIPRACDPHSVSYEFLEHLKDGVIFVSKYESRYIRFRPPHLIIFANHMPIPNLTVDRLTVYKIENNDFVFQSGKLKI